MPVTLQPGGWTGQQGQAFHGFKASWLVAKSVSCLDEHVHLTKYKTQKIPTNRYILVGIFFCRKGDIKQKEKEPLNLF